MTFWTITALLSLIVAAALLLTLLRYRGEGSSAAHDMQVYRDQLQELDRDLARGVLAPEEAERARTEISRRILEADRKARRISFARTGTGTSVAAALMTVVVVGGAFVLYRQLGAPGYPDLPMASRIAASKESMESRPAQAVAEAQVPTTPPVQEPDPAYVKLVERLRSTLSDKSDDPRGFDLLARSESILGRYADAHRAKARAIALKADAANAEDYVQLADLLIMAAGGYVSPEAEKALRAALARDAENGIALYYSGIMFLQNGRPDLSFRIWRKLLADGPQEASYREAILAQMPEVAQLAGERYSPPAKVASSGPAPFANGAVTLPGPDAAAVAAAGDMSDEERNQMIRGMVDRLSNRLATEGGTPGEWARLIGALGVLGDTDRARAIWGEARTVFAGKQEALAQVRQAAESAGIAE